MVAVQAGGVLLIIAGTTAMKTITFYHSVICPRCHAAGLMLSGLLREFPDIRVEKIEFLIDQKRAREDGVRSISTLVCGDRSVSGFFLGRKRIRSVLESL